MIRYLITLLAAFSFCGNLKSQPPQTFLIQFDKPFYTVGETVWFALFRTDSGLYENENEVLHFELISPTNSKVIYSKILMNERLAQGYLKLPTNLDEGYYRFRAYTLKNLQGEGEYIYADIPVYSEWRENLNVYKYEEVLENNTEYGGEVVKDKKRNAYSRRDTVEYSKLFSELKDLSQFAFWVQPKEFEKLPPIQSSEQKVSNTIQLHSNLIAEDSLYFEAFLSDESGTGVTSPVISIYSGENKRFFRSKCQDGWLSLNLPNYDGNFTLQVFNMNPYQEAVNELRVRQWTITEGYFNPTKPPVTKEIADYLIKAKQRRKINDLFDLNLPKRDIIVYDSSQAVPDLMFNMSDYRYINNLREFIFEAIPGARVVEQPDGTESIRLYNPERRAIFVDRPWYIIDGYLTSREEEVLKIPFSDIEEIKLYVHTNTIKNHFEFFLWRNGILEVKTKDVKYLRSLKTDPNYVDFTGLLPALNFLQSQGQLSNTEIPDFRTTMFWDAGNWSDTSTTVSFPLSDDTGRFVYQILGVSDSGELIRKEGEFEVR